MYAYNVGFCAFFFGCRFGCPYQCSCLNGNTRLSDDLSCVKWDVKRLLFRKVKCCRKCSKTAVRWDICRAYLAEFCAIRTAAVMGWSNGHMCHNNRIMLCVQDWQFAYDLLCWNKYITQDDHLKCSSSTFSAFVRSTVRTVKMTPSWLQHCKHSQEFLHHRPVVFFFFFFFFFLLQLITLISGLKSQLNTNSRHVIHVELLMEGLLLVSVVTGCLLGHLSASHTKFDSWCE